MLSFIRVLCVVALLVMIFVTIAQFAATGVSLSTTASALLTLALLAAIVGVENARARASDREAKAQHDWQGSELIVRFRWARWVAIIGVILVLIAFVLIALVVPTTGASFMKSLIGTSVSLFFLWFVVIGSVSAWHALRAGHALKIDSSGVHVPGRYEIAWAEIHGASVMMTVEQRSQQLIRLLVRDAAQWTGFSVPRLLFGPLESLSRKDHVLAINAALLDIHPECMRSALTLLASRHAPRFDDAWYEGKSLADALRSADRRKTERADLLAFETANQALLSMATRVKDESDPAFQKAMQSLNAAMARTEVNAHALMDEHKALMSHVKGRAKRLKWSAVALVVILLVVLVAKIYSRMGRG